MTNEHEFEAVMARLKFVLAIHTDGQVANKLGLSSSAYANLKKRGSLPYEKINALAISQNMNLHWLYTSMGEPEQVSSQAITGQPPLPSVDKLNNRLQGLSERQLRLLEATIEEYHASNQMREEIDRIRQRLDKGSGEPPV
jgi:CI repressor-like protein